MSETEKKVTDTVVKSEPSSLHEMEIVSGRMTDQGGNLLKYTFNNSEGTCILELNGELIELKQERTASGIKYSNEQYSYTNWHGETRLSNDGKLIFSHDE
ncbi:MAG TPA: MliC family protein [Prolixibacteraceae bacterium]|nr:MliC family protein [Prolixibacteraceae bacterium]